LVVLLAGLDLHGGARVALEVADLLRSRVGPRPQLAGPHRVPERHEVRPAVAADRRHDRGSLLVEEGRQLAVRHADLVATAHAAASWAAASRTASRASAGSITAASPASLSTSLTSHATPAKLSSTISAPSASSCTTERSSRAQRARSGEIHTRARREAGTS